MNPEVFWANVKKRNPYMRASDIARLIGEDRNTVSRWIRKNYVPKTEKAILIAKELGCDVSELFIDQAVPV